MHEHSHRTILCARKSVHANIKFVEPWSGHINNNMHFWAQTQPHEHTHHPLSQEKVTVWCAIRWSGIIGLYFCEDENENRVTVDTDRYIALMWMKFILALRRKRGVDMNTVIYQQDRAPPHCSDSFGIPWLVFSWR